MDLYGFFLGIWLGVGTYRMFELIEIDRFNEEENGIVAHEEYGMSPFTYFFWSLVAAYAWPVTMPIAYFMDDEDDG